MRELKRMLEGIGVEVNSFFPAVGDFAELQRVPVASLNLVLSTWFSQPSMDWNLPKSWSGASVFLICLPFPLTV
jgi:hypothetical protein